MHDYLMSDFCSDVCSTNNIHISTVGERMRTEEHAAKLLCVSPPIVMVGEFLWFIDKLIRIIGGNAKIWISNLY